jgi:SNF2 family DNA or RNA helicase
VIALLVLCRRQRPPEAAASPQAPPLPPSLVVAPASLLGTWQAEIARFAPHLRVLVAHPSETPVADLAALDPARVAPYDVILTSYGTLARLEPLRRIGWDVVVADEAQAIKNAGTRQARAVRALTGRCRLALTGTPVENRLGDLWSIFTFAAPGLLGNQSGGWRSGPTTPTPRCDRWSAPTSCGGSRPRRRSSPTSPSGPR